MDATKTFYQRTGRDGLERYIREHCLHRVVKNDGVELRRLLEESDSIIDLKHKGNFVFEVQTLRFGTILIWTEPADEEAEYIRITGYSIKP